MVFPPIIKNVCFAQLVLEILLQTTVNEHSSKCSPTLGALTYSSTRYRGGGTADVCRVGQAYFGPCGPATRCLVRRPTYEEHSGPA